jgi:CheY-like chemotaxis protein
MDANEVILLAMAPGESRAALQKELESLGFALLLAPSGREAFALLQKTPVAFLCCDARLPDMDAFELCRQIRALGAPLTPPIGLIASSSSSGFSNDATLLRGLEWGLRAVFNLDKIGALRAASARIAYLARRKFSDSEPFSDIEIFFGGQIRRCLAGAQHAVDYLFSIIELYNLALSPSFSAPEQGELRDLQSDELFLANLSHDIRDKVHSLVALADFALEGEMTERQRDMAHSVRPAVEALLAPLNELLALYRHSRRSPESTSLKEPAASCGRRILLVEDNPINKAFISRVLERAGHFPLAVENGREAIEALKAGDFEAVLMDIQMPVMDGLEATAAIRKGEADGPNKSNRDIPILAITAYAMAGDRERFLAAGMNEYLAKPLDIDAFHAALRHSLSSISSSPLEGDPSLVLDREKTLKRLKGDAKFLRLLYTTFNNDSLARMERFQSAIAEQDYIQVQRQAHSLKGVAATIDAGRLREASFSLELAARSEDPTSVSAAFSRLAERLEELQEQLALHLS